MQVDYHAKYLKYKQKYLDLKEEMIGSGEPTYEFPEAPNNPIYDVLPQFKSKKKNKIGCVEVTTIKNPKTGASITGTPHEICTDKIKNKLPWVNEILKIKEVKKMCKKCK